MRSVWIRDWRKLTKNLYKSNLCFCFSLQFLILVLLLLSDRKPVSEAETDCDCELWMDGEMGKQIQIPFFLDINETWSGGVCPSPSPSPTLPCLPTCYVLQIVFEKNEKGKNILCIGLKLFITLVCSANPSGLRKDWSHSHHQQLYTRDQDETGTGHITNILIHGRGPAVNSFHPSTPLHSTKGSVGLWIHFIQFNLISFPSV